MKPKVFIDMLPYGYTRERNIDGSVALSLNTEGTSAFVFVKKVPLKNRMPAITENDIDSIQCDLGFNSIIIDWYSDENCRYFITMIKENDSISYRIILNAFFGNETFNLHGTFYEKGNKGIRETIYEERYLKQRSPDDLTTNTDFANERYDIIFPDHPLSHCRRLANVITLNAACAPQTDNRENIQTFPIDSQP